MRPSPLTLNDRFVRQVLVVVGLVTAVTLLIILAWQTLDILLLLYLGIQIVESYFLTPLIQRKTVALPPVLLILSQVVFGYFFNFIGLAVAAPVTAMLLTLVKMVYVKDLLGDEEMELLKEDPEPHFTAAQSSPSANQ